MKVGQGDLLFVCDQGSLVGHRMQDYKCLYTLGVVGVEGGVTPAFSVLGNGIYEIARRTSRAIRLRNVKNGEKITQQSGSSQNRKWKYGGKHINKFADPDFLFDCKYIRGLSRLLLVVCRERSCITPIIKDVST